MKTQQALRQFERTRKVDGASTDANQSGNGGIMRLAPAVMVASSLEQAAEFAVVSSRTTHASPDCLDAATLFGQVLWRLFQGEAIVQALTDLPTLSPEGDSVVAIQAGLFRHCERHEISSSGYVIDTLEAALWCCWQADSFEDALILAANLGDDADTVAAVTGQLAGAAWGVEAIPERRLTSLAWRNMMTDMADGLLALAQHCDP